MRNSKLAFATLLAVASLSHANAADHRLTISHLKGNVYIVEDGFYYPENSVVYVGDKHVTVIGATWSTETARLLSKEIGKITSKPIRNVINTNYHPDRAGGNSYFKSIGAKVLSTKMTFDLMKVNWGAMIKYTQKTFSDYPFVELALPDKTFAGDFDLHNGNVKAIYLGPAHTPDGIFVYFPQENILYGGCILKESLGNLDFANLAEYPKTLKKLGGFEIQKIIAGHGAAIHGPDLIYHYIRLLEERGQ